ncbi:MAG TPA: CDP-glycerol glycerophosphotransferase family protein [Treponemataceae bacterium]|nr:CDP-glycerol glycerophosphotransferase family protein [Treponemataceae bacterium]
MYSALFLYIDPGTGSMLFSIIIGLAAALYFIARTTLVRFKGLFTGSTRHTSDASDSIVLYSEGNHYWNVFSPVLEEFERRNIPVRYLTSSENDQVFSRSWNSVRTEYIGNGNRAYARLNFLVADVCLMTTPALDVYQLKRSRGVKHYTHVLHAVDDATSYRLFGLDYFDSVLLSGEYQKAGIRELEKKRGLPQKDLVVVGCPYLDVLQLRENSNEPHDNFTVLVSPSWGPDGLLRRYGEQLLEPLVQTQWSIIVRPHPQSLKSEKESIDRLRMQFPESPSFSWDFSPDNHDALRKSDVMISDFSSIMFDFCFLFNRPFLYANTGFNDEIYDSSDCDETPWKFRILPEIGMKLDPSAFSDIKKTIETLCTDEVRAENRIAARDTAWQYRGESGVRIVDYLVKKQRELSC